MTAHRLPNRRPSDMTELADLATFDFIYVATPFTKYAAGLEAAWVDACKLMGDLARGGLLNALSPIVEAYPISLHGALDPLDLSIWQPFCDARMAKSDALVVGMLDDWEHSAGTRHEIYTFAKSARPFFLMNPANLSFRLGSSKDIAMLGIGA